MPAGDGGLQLRVMLSEGCGCDGETAKYCQDFPMHNMHNRDVTSLSQERTNFAVNNKITDAVTARLLLYITATTVT